MNENVDVMSRTRGLLEDIFPEDLAMRPAQGIQGLLRAILMRTNFVPVARHVIGWRGLKQDSTPDEGWTARIRGYDGIFGLSYCGLALVRGWIQGRFSLHYFPHPDEELVEGCSLRAAAMTQNNDYMAWVREFQAWPELAELFRIAELTLSVTAQKDGIALGLDAQTARRSISESGVVAQRHGSDVQLIAPGGYDWNFPAFETASAFYDVLAASTTFNLGKPPAFLCEKKSSGFDVIEDATGRTRVKTAADNNSHFLMLGYGAGSFDELDVHGDCPVNIFAWSAPKQLPDAFRDRPWWSADRIQGSSSMDKKTLGLDRRPPLIVLTGFLGSGKTTLLKNFIEYQTQRSRFVAVIQNEIGAVGLDGKLIDYAVTEIDEGCVCCSLAGSLKRAVAGILSDFDPDCIIVETTGLANPLNLLEEMSELDEMTRFDCIVTVVDAANAAKIMARHHIAVEQVRGADIVVVNKRDLVDEGQLDAVMRLVKDCNPHAPVFPVTNGEINPSLILDAEVRESIAFPECRHEPRHLSHVHEGLWSKSISIPRPLGREAFLDIVDRLPVSIFRAKGIIEFADSPQALLFQYVGGRYEISVFPQQSEPNRFLTLIGQGGDPDGAAAAIQALGAPAVS